MSNSLFFGHTEFNEDPFLSTDHLESIFDRYKINAEISVDGLASMIVGLVIGVFSSENNKIEAGYVSSTYKEIHFLLIYNTKNDLTKKARLFVFELLQNMPNDPHLTRTSVREMKKAIKRDKFASKLIEDALENVNFIRIFQPTQEVYKTYDQDGNFVQRNENLFGALKVENKLAKAKLSHGTNSQLLQNYLRINPTMVRKHKIFWPFDFTQQLTKIEPVTQTKVLPQMSLTEFENQPPEYFTDLISYFKINGDPLGLRVTPENSIYFTLGVSINFIQRFNLEFVIRHGSNLKPVDFTVMSRTETGSIVGSGLPTTFMVQKYGKGIEEKICEPNYFLPKDIETENDAWLVAKVNFDSTNINELIFEHIEFRGRQVDMSIFETLASNMNPKTKTSFLLNEISKVANDYNVEDTFAHHMLVQLMTIEQPNSCFIYYPFETSLNEQFKIFLYVQDNQGTLVTIGRNSESYTTTSDINPLLDGFDMLESLLRLSIDELICYNIDFRDPNVVIDGKNLRNLADGLLFSDTAKTFPCRIGVSKIWLHDEMTQEVRHPGRFVEMQPGLVADRFNVLNHFSSNPAGFLQEMFKQMENHGFKVNSADQAHVSLESLLSVVDCDVFHPIPKDKSFLALKLSSSNDEYSQKVLWHHLLFNPNEQNLNSIRFETNQQLQEYLRGNKILQSHGDISIKTTVVSLGDMRLFAGCSEDVSVIFP